MKILEILTKQRKTGNIGEKAAIRALKKNGYKILEKNYVVFNSEIDIIAEDKTTVAFVEVKTRTVGSLGFWEARPAASVTPTKQRKIINAAKYYLATYNKEKRVSLDVIEVYLNERGNTDKVIHMKNAFNVNSANERGYKRK